jgi:hypothetical protein
MSPRSVRRVLAIVILCGLPLLLLAVLVGGRPLTVLPTPSPAVPGVPVAELGIGELEMGPDFGRPATPVQRGPIATALLYGLLLLCPAKFVLLWMLQRQESRDIAPPAGAPASGNA